MLVLSATEEEVSAGMPAPSGKSFCEESRVDRRRLIVGILKEMEGMFDEMVVFLFLFCLAWFEFLRRVALTWHFGLRKFNRFCPLHLSTLDVLFLNHAPSSCHLYMHYMQQNIQE